VVLVSGNSSVGTGSPSRSQMGRHLNGDRAVKLVRGYARSLGIPIHRTRVPKVLSAVGESGSKP